MQNFTTLGKPLLGEKVKSPEREKERERERKRERKKERERK